MVDPDGLHIVEFPAPCLRQVASRIKSIDDEIRCVAQRMIELMREAEGIGLAAPQVGLPWRLFVVEIPPGETPGEGDDRTADGETPSATLGPRVYINPTISGPEGDLEIAEEGCLSLPELVGDVRRPPVITIRSTDIDGQEREERGSGLLARCWQHENDHLDGVLIFDRFTQISRIKNRSAIRRLKRNKP